MRPIAVVSRGGLRGQSRTVPWLEDQLPLARVLLKVEGPQHVVRLCVSPREALYQTDAEYPRRLPSVYSLLSRDRPALHIDDEKRENTRFCEARLALLLEGLREEEG